MNETGKQYVASTVIFFDTERDFGFITRMKGMPKDIYCRMAGRRKYRLKEDGTFAFTDTVERSDPVGGEMVIVHVEERRGRGPAAVKWSPVPKSLFERLPGNVVRG